MAVIADEVEDKENEVQLLQTKSKTEENEVITSIFNSGRKTNLFTRKERNYGKEFVEI